MQPESKGNVTWDALREKCAGLSMLIHESKQAELKTEKRTRWQWSDKEGNPAKEFSEGAKWKEAEYESVVQHMNPACLRWSVYVNLRRDAALYFTAYAIYRALGHDDFKGVTKSQAVKALEGVTGVRKDRRHAIRGGVN